jgi:hypothetical protein
VAIGPDDAEPFVRDRVAEGADYIKMIAEGPETMGSVALGEATLATIVQAVHAQRLRVFAHVTAVNPCILPY